MIKTLQTLAIDLWLLEQDHILTKKKKKQEEKNMALLKQTKQGIKVFD